MDAATPLDDLLAGLKTVPTPQSYYLFEQYVLDLLRSQARAEAREMVPRVATGTETLRHQFDAVLPSGLSPISGPCAVTVRYFTEQKPPSRRRLHESLMRTAHNANQAGMAAVLLIHAAPMTPALLDVVSELQVKAPVQLYVWDLDKLRALSVAHAAEVPGTLQELALAPLRQALTETSPDWNQVRDKQLDRLGQTYRTEGLVLFLGAGVSVGAGLQDWNGLLGALFIAVFTQQLEQPMPTDHAQPLAAVARALNSNSPLLLARYLQRGYEDLGTQEDHAFRENLVATLYGRAASQATTSLLEAVVRISAPLRGGAKVHAVITYNFDDLLELALEQRGLAYRSIYHEARQANEQELPIHHVHGYLPRRSEGLDRVEDSLLAFSEEGYHELYRDPYHWSNIVQLNALRERSCLFLGLSMTDPNLRRLLEISARGTDHQEPRHYAFLKRVAVQDVTSDPSFRDVSPDERTITAFLNVHHALQERVLRELGIDVIWFERHDEMPEALQSVMPRR